MNYKDAQAGEDVATSTTVDALPCKVCGTPTARATLSLYGARCVGCYRTHQRATPQRDPRMQGIDEDAGGGPLAWARRVLLRAQRHVDPPSRAAQDMAADALRQRGGGSE